MNLTERLIIKTMESPCRTCTQRFNDRELCMEDCAKLGAFQDGMIQVSGREGPLVFHSTSCGVKPLFPVSPRGR